MFVQSSPISLFPVQISTSHRESAVPAHLMVVHANGVIKKVEFALLLFFRSSIFEFSPVCFSICRINYINAEGAEFCQIRFNISIF